MRIQQFLTFAAAATLSVSALAQSPSIDASNSTVTVQGGKSTVHRLSPYEAQFMKGAFGLDDGRTFTLVNRGSKLYAELDGKREELVPVGDKRFIGRDSGNRVAFDQVPFAQEVVIDQLLPSGQRISMVGR